MLRFIIALIAVALVTLTNAFGYDHSSWQLKEKSTERLLNNIGTLYHFNAYQYKHFPVALTLVEINQDKARIVYENDEVGVHHSIVTFNDGNVEAVMAVYRYKDGKITSLETGATPMSK